MIIDVRHPPEPQRTAIRFSVWRDGVVATPYTDIDQRRPKLADAGLTDMQCQPLILWTQDQILLVRIVDDPDRLGFISDYPSRVRHTSNLLCDRVDPDRTMTCPPAGFHSIEEVDERCAPDWIRRHMPIAVFGQSRAVAPQVDMACLYLIIDALHHAAFPRNSV